MAWSLTLLALVVFITKLVENKARRDRHHSLTLLLVELVRLSGGGFFFLDNLISWGKLSLLVWRRGRREWLLALVELFGVGIKGIIRILLGLFTRRKLGEGLLSLLVYIKLSTPMNAL